MPQMAPMNWIMLYIFFTTLFLMFNFMNYYIFTTKNFINKKINKKIIFLNWKW